MSLHILSELTPAFVLSDWLSHNPAGLKFTMKLKTNLGLIPYTLYPPLYMMLGIDRRASYDWEDPPVN